MGYFRNNIEKMAGYVPGFQPKATEVVKLNTNENPYPPSPQVMKVLAEIKAEQLRRYPDPLAAEFRKAMDVTGAGNNPAFIRAFYKLAQKVTEGHIVTNGKPSPLGQTAPDAAPKSASGTFYPNL